MEDSKKIAENSTQITHLKKKPSITNHNHNHHNQVLQVVCLTDKDNYLDMLTEQWGDYNRALKYIKDCALSSLAGDCQLIEKIYFGKGENNDPDSFEVDSLDN